MGDAKSMQILNRVHDLNKNPACRPLRESNFLRHEFEKLTLLHILGYQINVVIAFDDLVELDDVGVTDCPQDLNFSIDTLFIIFISDSILVDDLDGHHFGGGQVHSRLHFAESALAQSLLKLVVV